MSGYKIALILYSHIEVRREIEIPDNISFLQLHNIIQKIFNFDNYHMWDFQVPEKLNENEVNLGNPIETITYEDASNVKIKDYLDKNDVLLYVYDYGDNWEIVVHVMERTDYKNKTAVILDFNGKYGPIDDIGGPMVFEEIMESLDDEDELLSILSDYGMDKTYLNKMDFTKKFKKGSKIRIQ